MSEQDWNKQLLKSHNPFGDTIARSAWDESPDVKSINGDLSELVINVLQEAKENKITKMMLVQGQPGIGKTHFISRLRRLSKENEYLFVAVKPVSSVTSIFSHIYREIFTSLRKRKKDEKYNSMEILISYIISNSLVKTLRDKRKSAKLNKRLHTLIESLEKDPTIILSLIDSDLNTIKLLQPLSEIAIKNVERDHPDVDINFLKVLFKTLESDLQHDAMRWLQGDDIDDDKLLLLGVKDSISDESVAQHVLHSIMTLSNQPLLLCFDQLESIYDRFHDPHVLITFFDTLVRLCNETPNALILLMVQSAVWAEQMSTMIQTSAKDRIEHMTYIQAPNQDEMVDLVAKRLNHVWKIFPYPPEINTYPFAPKYITGLSEKQGWNPRSVLKHLSAEFQSMKLKNDFSLLSEFTIGNTKVIEKSEPSVKENTFQDFIDNELKKVISQYKENLDSKSYIAREDYLIAGFFDLLKGLKDRNKPINDILINNITFKKKPKDLDMIVTLKYPDNSLINLGLEICNNERGGSFNNLLKMIQKKLNNNSIDRWMIVRDKNLFPIKKTWKKSIEMLDTLSNSGSINEIEIEDDAKLYGCKELLDLSSSGDLDLNGKIISRKELLAYLLENIIQSISIFYSMFEEGDSHIKEPIIKIKTSKRDNKDVIKSKILEQANNTMMVSINKIFSDFSKRPDFYKNIVEELVNDFKLIYLVNKDQTLVVTKPADEDIF